MNVVMKFIGILGFIISFGMGLATVVPFLLFVVDAISLMLFGSVTGLYVHDYPMFDRFVIAIIWGFAGAVLTALWTILVATVTDFESW